MYFTSVLFFILCRSLQWAITFSTIYLATSRGRNWYVSDVFCLCEIQWGQVSYQRNGGTSGACTLPELTLYLVNTKTLEDWQNPTDCWQPFWSFIRDQLQSLPSPVILEWITVLRFWQLNSFPLKGMAFNILFSSFLWMLVVEASDTPKLFHAFSTNLQTVL